MFHLPLLNLMLTACEYLGILPCFFSDTSLCSVTSAGQIPYWHPQQNMLCLFVADVQIVSHDSWNDRSVWFHISFWPLWKCVEESNPSYKITYSINRPCSFTLKWSFDLAYPLFNSALLQQRAEWHCWNLGLVTSKILVVQHTVLPSPSLNSVKSLPLQFYRSWSMQVTSEPWHHTDYRLFPNGKLHSMVIIASSLS